VNKQALIVQGSQQTNVPEGGLISVGEGGSGGLTMSSAAEMYWRYSQKCTRQAVEAETDELRDQLLGLARLWTEGAVCEELKGSDPHGHQSRSQDHRVGGTRER
jgi:hypothetical protein